MKVRLFQNTYEFPQCSKIRFCFPMFQNTPTSHQCVDMLSRLGVSTIPRKEAGWSPKALHLKKWAGKRTESPVIYGWFVGNSWLSWSANNLPSFGGMHAISLSLSQSGHPMTTIDWKIKLHLNWIRLSHVSFCHAILSGVHFPILTLCQTDICNIAVTNGYNYSWFTHPTWWFSTSQSLTLWSRFTSFYGTSPCLMGKSTINGHFP